MGVGLTQFLAQNLSQRRRGVLGGAVEVCVSVLHDTMPAHAAETRTPVQVVGKGEPVLLVRGIRR